MLKIQARKQFLADHALATSKSEQQDLRMQDLKLLFEDDEPVAMSAVPGDPSNCVDNEDPESDVLLN